MKNNEYISSYKLNMIIFPNCKYKAEFISKGFFLI